MTQNEWLAILPFLARGGRWRCSSSSSTSCWPRRDDLVMAVSVVGLGIALAVTLVTGPLPGCRASLPGGRRGRVRRALRRATC